MGERALGLGLRLLGLALAIGPFIIALGMHNWDIQEAVMPSEDEMTEVKGALSGLFGGEFSLVNIIENRGPPTIDLKTGEVEMMFDFTSPFNVQVKITDISIGIFCEHKVRLASMQMKEKKEVEVQPNGTATFTLVGTLTQDASQHILNVHGGTPPTDIRLENASFGLEFYGVTLRLSMGAMEGG